MAKAVERLRCFALILPIESILNGIFTFARLLRRQGRIIVISFCATSISCDSENLEAMMLSNYGVLKKTQSQAFASLTLSFTSSPESAPLPMLRAISAPFAGTGTTFALRAIASAPPSKYPFTTSPSILAVIT